MPKVYTAFFKRELGKVDGVFTLQWHDPTKPHIEPVKIFNRLPARSGSPRDPDNAWKVGVGAIPKGEYYLWLRDPVDPGPDFPTTPGGIGKAYRISNSLTDHDTIYGPNGKKRTLVRLHPENCYKGSAGCTATVWNKDGTLEPIPRLKSENVRLFSFLDMLSKDLEYIKYVVLQ
jgi:hypothetical protein